MYPMYSGSIYFHHNGLPFSSLARPSARPWHRPLGLSTAVWRGEIIASKTKVVRGASHRPDCRYQWPRSLGILSRIRWIASNQFNHVWPQIDLTRGLYHGLVVASSARQQRDRDQDHEANR